MANISYQLWLLAWRWRSHDSRSSKNNFPNEGGTRVQSSCGIRLQHQGKEQFRNYIKMALCWFGSFPKEHLVISLSLTISSAYFIASVNSLANAAVKCVSKDEVIEMWTSGCLKLHSPPQLAWESLSWAREWSQTRHSVLAWMRQGSRTAAPGQGCWDVQVPEQLFWWWFLCGCGTLGQLEEGLGLMLFH